jgi:hypothetical protein
MSADGSASARLEAAILFVGALFIRGITFGEFVAVVRGPRARIFFVACLDDPFARAFVVGTACADADDERKRPDRRHLG